MGNAVAMADEEYGSQGSGQRVGIRDFGDNQEGKQDEKREGEEDRKRD